MQFPNRAGAHADNDAILLAELRAAGIPTIQEWDGHPPDYLAEVFRDISGEVKTAIVGCLYKWKFTRFWRYWVAEGPGIDVETAEALHAVHGQVVRVDGDCSCPSPKDRYKGLGCGYYHIDTPDGLKALADAIKAVAKRHSSQASPSIAYSPAILKDPQRQHEVAQMALLLRNAGYHVSTNDIVFAWQDWSISNGTPWLKIENDTALLDSLLLAFGVQKANGITQKQKEIAP